jgi:glycosyltransferase involved in cell wall biosynthesis
MRVAYLSADPGIAYGGAKGASVHVAELTSALAAQGHEVLLLVAARAPYADRVDGLEIEVLPGAWTAPAAKRAAAQGELAAWLAARLDAAGADVLYERFSLHCAAGTDAAQALRIPHLLELNAPLLQEAAAYRRLDAPDEAAALERRALQGADVVLPVSPPLATHAWRSGARRVEVFPNAVDVRRYAPRREHAGPPVAVFAGALRPWHGAETIAEAWRMLGAGAPALTVIGEGPGREALAAAGARMAGRVPHADVPRLLGEAHIGLAPYAADAPTYFSPLKVFEYLAAGLATVAGNLPGLTALLPPDAIRFVPRGDPGALAGAVAALAADPAARMRLGDGGRALVERDHTWTKRAERVTELALSAGAAKVGAA